MPSMGSNTSYDFLPPPSFSDQIVCDEELLEDEEKVLAKALGTTRYQGGLGAVRGNAARIRSPT